jgi:hypothetical protein
MHILWIWRCIWYMIHRVQVVWWSALRVSFRYQNCNCGHSPFRDKTNQHNHLQSIVRSPTGQIHLRTSISVRIPPGFRWLIIYDAISQYTPLQIHNLVKSHKVWQFFYREMMISTQDVWQARFSITFRAISEIRSPPEILARTRLN